MLFQIHVVGLTDIGRVRRRNEDAVCVAPEEGVAVVADGMGGHPGGDVASSVAAAHALRRLQDLRLRDASQSTTGTLADTMSELVIDAHVAVRERGASEPGLEGMGTTLTALTIDGASGSWAIGHAGDSRAYLMRHGVFRQLTRDDTWVQQRVDAAELTPTEARRHPFGHIVTQCLGLDRPPVPQTLGGTALPGDLFLLCTDGLVGMLEDQVVSDALRTHLSGHRDPTTMAGAARTLVAMANDRGGYDNITVALAAIW